MHRNAITSDLALRSIKPGDPRSRISDGDGLFLLLAVDCGLHGWRFDYMFGGKRKMLSLGTYPDTSLALARRKADEARRLLAEGINPSDQRKAAKAAAVKVREAEKLEAKGLPPADSFEAVGREWYDVKKSGWAPKYAEKIIARLENDIFPWIGRLPVNAVSPPRLLEVLRRLESRGVVETAHRALDNCSQVFRYAVAIGKTEHNPARDLKDALRRPAPKHFPAITNPARLGELLRACDAYAATHVVRAALKLAPMLLLRPGELRFGEWSEVDFDSALWTVPSARMKREKREKVHGAPHLVPLPRQALTVLRELHSLTGEGKLMFRGERHHDRAMSDNTINAALRAMGFAADEVTGHGFRATARTMLHERLGFSPDVIEAQLAHSVRDSLGRAYNRTEFIEQRRAMLQRWADYLDELRSGATIGLKKPGRSALDRRPGSASQR